MSNKPAVSLHIHVKELKDLHPHQYFPATLKCA